MASRDRHKTRKPAVEKMRRDRINGCIEQLKVLLEEEVHKRDPDAKLEKADVLEMTVGFLQRRLRPRGSAPRGDGYSRCCEETLHFLRRLPKEEARHPVLSSACGRGDGDHVPAAAKPAPPVWRPW
ncbi:transcription factor HES-5-like [Cyclopterus lumpus]|uniref:transcription factor HES-5-like n=1 Tax=Cyclopterus lumpus TaxID=8103 RepID=UPI00148697C3|nr:transcription factor HES-5-like [Cyclopterus lumpus]